MKQAKERIFLTEDGRLVAEGDKDAAFLFLAKGNTMPENRLTEFDNVDEFFEDATETGVFGHGVPTPPKEMVPGASNVGKKTAQKGQPQEKVVHKSTKSAKDEEATEAEEAAERRYSSKQAKHK